MAKVTGIGGVFFKANDPKALAAWYAEHLGMPLQPWGGAILEWPADAQEDGGLTVWNLSARDSDWFSPSEANLMINYRVDDLPALLAQLTEAGVEIVAGPETHENGQFAWVMDPEGNKVELWQAKPWTEASASE